MRCKICDSEDIRIIYKDSIRDGALGHYTAAMIPIYQCGKCGVIWHEPVLENLQEYYESQEYRKSLEGTSEEEEFYRLHDHESMDKFKYTGTTVFRNKTILDLGCGCGAFLDFIKGVAAEVVAVEPSETYRNAMVRKGFQTFAYAKDALEGGYRGKVDVLMSFDVIEHVDDPKGFLSDTYQLLCPGGAGHHRHADRCTSDEDAFRENI